MNFNTVMRVANIVVVVLVPVYLYLVVRTAHLAYSLTRQAREQAKQGEVIAAGLEFVRHVIGCRVCLTNPHQLCPIGKMMMGDYLGKDERARLPSEVKR